MAKQAEYLACTNLTHNEVDCGVAGIPMDDACGNCRKAFFPLTDAEVEAISRGN